MMRKTKSLFVFGVASLALALVTGDVAAQEILITPADPAISVGQTQQFTATGISTATALDAGSYHTCAILQDATVDCWGQNDYGQLGDGTPVPTPATSRPTPVPVTVTGITTAVAIEAGIFHTCALLQDGTMQCWGWNDYYQLGNQSAINASSTPVTVDGITPAL